MITWKAITYAGSVAWNKLPNAIKEAQSLNVFKAKLKEYLLEYDEAHIYLKLDFFFSIFPLFYLYI